MRFIVPVIALIGLLSGCVSHYSSYSESFSEVRISSDLKTLWVTGSGKYSYELNIPEPLSQVIDSPLKDGMHLMFRRITAFKVKEDGTISGSFRVIVPDTFLQDRDDLKQIAKDIGFSHGRTYTFRNITSVLEDGESITRYGSLSDADMERETKIMDDVYFLLISMSGHRFRHKEMMAREGDYSQELDRRYVVEIQDNQTMKVDLIGPSILIYGSSICVATWPACLVGALPMMGLRP